jgi:hypothetical protein
VSTERQNVVKRAVVPSLVGWRMPTVPARAFEAYRNPVAPLVFQAAGPAVASIQNTVDRFRASLGGVNNGNLAGPFASGRREINWDDYGSPVTAVATTPFAGFVNTRGALLTTDGTGFVQATASGLAATFCNATYRNVFQPFSPLRVFSPINSTVTEVTFFVPGGGEVAAVTPGFGVVFSGSHGTNNGHCSHEVASVECFDVEGEPLYGGSVLSSPGNATLSFIGITFNQPRIACVRITSGRAALGTADVRKEDVVVMDDFIFGEPRQVSIVM